MSKFFHRASFLLTSTLTCIASITFPLTVSAAPTDLASSVNGIFSSFTVAGVPGAAVVVVQNGEVLFKGAYGLSDIDNGIPVESDTAFHLASVGKQMTAAAVLLLEQEGKLSVEDLVSKYLPQLKGFGSRVKVKHLLYHTSGLPDYYDDIESSFPRPNNSQALRFLQGLRRLDFAPGARFSYSNSGYDTLGALVQKVGKRKFGEYMQANVFGPLRMSNTFAFDNARRKVSKRALGYYLDGGEYYLDDTSPLNGLHGSGSIYTTIDDMVEYDRALFGGTLLSAESFAKMFTSGTTNNGRSLQYGYGWDVVLNSQYGGTYYGHSGGWMGFSTYYLHYPDRKLSVIVLSNSSETDAESLAFDTAAAVQ